MTIPDFQSLMLPILAHLGDGEKHTLEDYTSHLVTLFGVTEDQQRERLPSDRAPVFSNRVGWAVTYLFKAGLIDRTGRKRVRITESGQAVLADPPSRIGIAYLNRFPPFMEFNRGAAKSDPKTKDDPQSVIVVPPTSLSPDEQLEASYNALRNSLALDLLQRVKDASPTFFEQLVIDLLVAMGYGGSRKDAGAAVGGSHDGGIDGIIKEDKLGLDFVYVQAKRWTDAVSRPTVQAFAGSLEGQRARKGVLITTSRFTAEAREYVGRIEKRIVLIDGEQLAQLMLDYSVGVADVASYRVQRVDLDYFEEV